MLIFISDLHLTDGTSGQTIKPTAFRIFAESLENLAKTVNPLHEIKIVLLGDIFDLIRSAKWLEGSVRPWDAPGDAQMRKVEEILAATLQNNEDSLEHLRNLANVATSRGVPFIIDYITGNHDWIINRYPSAVAQVARKLGWADSPARFPDEVFFPDYHAYACHSDRYDDINFHKTRDASSIGDAIVIELLNRFPTLVEGKLNYTGADWGISEEERKSIILLLREIDNIRPLLDAPAWLLMVLKNTHSDKVRNMIEETWHQCVDDFFTVPFVKSFDKFLWPDLIDALQIILNLSCHTSGRFREKIAEAGKALLGHAEESKFREHAFEESRMRSGEAKYVLYGHTHKYEIVPLDQVPNNTPRPNDKLYFNTGTWRKTWNRTQFDKANREFIGWHVLTYVALFKPEENGDYNFEIWNSSLG